MSKHDDDNLFEDLDSFFEPIDEIGWPEETGFETPAAPVQDEPELAPEEPIEPIEPPEAPGVDTQGTEHVTETWSMEAPTEESDEDFDEMPQMGDAASEGEAATAEPSVVVSVGSDQNELLVPGPERAQGDETEPVEPGEPTVMQFDEVGLVDAEPGLGVLTEDGIEAAGGADEDIAAYAAADDRDIERDILGDLAPPDPEEVGSGIAEGLSGPSWQEPTHVEVGGDVAEPGAQRNLPAAFVTGVVLGVVAAISLIVSPVMFAWLAGAAVLFALFEFYVALQKRHQQPATIVGLIFGGFILYAGFLYGPSGSAIMLAVGVIFAVLWEIATPAKFRKAVTTSVGLTVFGMVYIPFLASFGMWILHRPALLEPSGKVLMFLILGMTFAYDTGAFMLGSMWGEHQLAPHISPKKSIEGAVFGTVIVLVIAIIFGPVSGLTLMRSIVLALVVVVAAPLGDLAESLIKRDLGIKDMGNILPGHGGVLDRIDSLLFVLPLAALVVMAAGSLASLAGV